MRYFFGVWLVFGHVAFAALPATEVSIDTLSNQLARVQERIVSMRKLSTQDAGTIRFAKRDQELNGLQLQFDDAMSDLQGLQKGSAANPRRAKENLNARIGTMKSGLTHLEAE